MYLMTSLDLLWVFWFVILDFLGRGFGLLGLESLSLPLLILGRSHLKHRMEYFSSPFLQSVRGIAWR